MQNFREQMMESCDIRDFKVPSHVRRMYSKAKLNDMLRVSLVIVFVIGYAFCNTLANSYVDYILGTAFIGEVEILSLDPAVLPDFLLDIQTGKVSAQAEFFSGFVTGLSKAKRHAECQGSKDFAGSRIISCHIMFDNLKVGYDGKIKYGNAPKSYILGRGKISNTVAVAEIIERPPLLPFAKSLSFAKLGNMKFRFRGKGPHNIFKRALMDRFKRRVQAEVFDIMRQKLQYVLTIAVANTSLPVF